MMKKQAFKMFCYAWQGPAAPQALRFGEKQLSHHVCEDFWSRRRFQQRRCVMMGKQAFTCFVIPALRLRSNSEA
jgi:hypothetical protein